jgi:hypothetical protein
LQTKEADEILETLREEVAHDAEEPIAPNGDGQGADASQIS